MQLNRSIINGSIINGSAELETVESSLVSVAYVTYTCVLTGTPDLTLQIESATIRKTSGGPIYLSVSVPSLALIDEITARSSGQLVLTQNITYLDGSTVSNEVARVDLANVTDYRGGRNSSVTLDGSRVSISAPKIQQVTGASYTSSTNGTRRYRVAVEYGLNAGDTADIDGTEIVANSVSVTLSPISAVMEIAE